MFWYMQYKLWKVVMVCSKVVDGVLTCYALLHFVCDLKAAQMNMEHSRIQVFMSYKLKLGHNTTEATKNM